MKGFKIIYDFTLLFMIFSVFRVPQNFNHSIAGRCFDISVLPIQKGFDETHACARGESSKCKSHISFCCQTASKHIYGKFTNSPAYYSTLGNDWWCDICWLKGEYKLKISNATSSGSKKVFESTIWKPKLIVVQFCQPKSSIRQHWKYDNFRLACNLHLSERGNHGIARGSWTWKILIISSFLVLRLS